MVFRRIPSRSNFRTSAGIQQGRRYSRLARLSQYVFFYYLLLELWLHTGDTIFQLNLMMGVFLMVYSIMQKFSWKSKLFSLLCCSLLAVSFVIAKDTFGLVVTLGVLFLQTSIYAFTGLKS